MAAVKTFVLGRIVMSARYMRDRSEGIGIKTFLVGNPIAVRAAQVYGSAAIVNTCCVFLGLRDLGIYRRFDTCNMNMKLIDGSISVSRRVYCKTHTGSVKLFILTEPCIPKPFGEFPQMHALYLLVFFNTPYFFGGNNQIVKRPRPGIILAATTRRVVTGGFQDSNAATAKSQGAFH